MTLICLFMGFSLASCSDDDDKPEIPAEVGTGYYFLNSGKMGSNNASLYFFNTTDKTTEAEVFKARNGRGLGDTAQDIVIYGSKMYIAVANSGTIEVTDLAGNSLEQIKSLKPRAMTTYQGYVYISSYDGFVARLDTTSYEVAKTAVGRNPEELAIANNKLYVANSGGMDYNTEVGYDKTVSVVDLNSFTETKKIEVVLNPGRLVAAGNTLYLISLGNYGDIPNSLQTIDATTDEVTEIGNATEMALLNNKLYLYYSQYDANWNQTITFYTYNTAKGEMTEGFITDGTSIAKPYKIFTDPVNKTVMVSESDYTTNGDIYIFNEAGQLQDKVEVGMNPMKGVAVTYYK